MGGKHSDRTWLWTNKIFVLLLVKSVQSLCCLKWDAMVQGGGYDGPTRVPGGGRGHPGMAGQGRGMARGLVMPPPGVPVDKWQQQGPMAPMPGQPTLPFLLLHLL